MVNSSVLEYRIFSADKVVTPQDIDRVGKAERAINKRSKYRNASSSDWRLRYFFSDKDLSAATFQWTLEQPALIARAMTATSDKLFIAGPPDLLDERQAYHSPDDPEIQAKLKRQAEALDGRAGGQLWIINKTDGALVTRYALDTIPVFDGIAAAGQSLYMTTVDGRVMCLSGRRGTPLRKTGDKPSQVIWDKPEDPSYLIAPAQPKKARSRQ
jgi:hypothetical protein